MQYSVIHGEFTSSDASALNEANSRFSLYGEGASAVTLDSADYVVITDVVINNGSAGALTLTVYDGADTTVSAGEKIWQGDIVTDGTVTVNLTTPHTCQKGTYPKAKAGASGQIDMYLTGYIKRLSS